LTTIGMHYDVIEGKGPEFEAGFGKVLDVLKTLPGHVETHMYQDVFTPGSYVIMSQWEKLENFQAFMKSEAFAKAVAWGRAEILRNRPRHKVYADQ